MKNTNDKSSYKEIARDYRDMIEGLNNSLSKPYRIKTKLANFEKCLFKHLVNNGNGEDICSVLISIAEQTGIPTELISDSEIEMNVFINDVDDEIEINEELEMNESVEEKEKETVDFKDIFEKGFNKTVKNNPVTSRSEVTSLVSQYYDIQAFRIAGGNRQFQLDNSGTSVAANNNNNPKNISFAYVNAGFKEIEGIIVKWLKDYVEHDKMGQWLIATKGIGPVLAAGLLSYIDISKCQTAGSIWRYAGWEGHRAPRKKGVKLDYNPKFRVLCWKCGESFQKLSGTKKDKDGNTIYENGKPVYKSYYGGLYAEKLKFYIDKNEAGGFAEAAKLALEEKNIQNVKTRATYESGKLPMAHMIAMAKRYAVKIFLSHLFEVWYEYENGVKPPRPFVEVHLGHVHIMEAPNKNILGLK